MSQTRIYQALVQAIKQTEGMVPFSTPGTKYIVPSAQTYVGTVGDYVEENYVEVGNNKQPYADFSFHPNEPEVDTLGSGGEDVHTGFAQLLLRFPVDTGALGTIRLGDVLRERFKAGTRFNFEGQEVFIVRSGLGKFDTFDGRLVNPFTIYWYAHTKR